MRTKVFARLGAWCVVGAVVAGMGIQAAEATPWSSDFDADSDVDLEDFSGFAACFNGPNRSPSTFCAVDADLDDDTDVDLADFSVFAACFNGPNRTPACEGDLLTVNIETVPVGNPGNAGEWSGQSYGGCGPDRVCGAVDYTYNIGKYEVTAGQYTAFLNKVAATDAYGLYNTNMWSSSYGCKIQRSGISGSYTYSVASNYANRPVNYVSWGDSARFANWLHNNQPTGPQGLSTTEDGAYFLNGATSDAALLAVNREADWKWAITSEDEWYKAAYHKNDGVTGNYFNYPTSSDSVPGRDLSDASGNNANYYGSPFPIDSPYYTTVAGEFQNSDSPYGTFDQGGNVWEWNEAVITTQYGSCRGLRGGSFNYYLYFPLHASYRSYYYPADGDYNLGFRVSEVPEPAPSGATGGR